MPRIEIAGPRLAIAGLLFVVVAVLAGYYAYTSLLGGGGGEFEVLRIGYLPIYPDAQFLIAYQLGWFDELKELGVKEVRVFRFEQGVAMIQAFAAGELDVLYVGMDPVLVGIEKGLPLRVVAANIVNHLALIGTEELAEYYDRYGARFLEKWLEDKGRPARIATLPKGTTPDIVMRIILQSLGYDPVDPPVEVLPMGIPAVRAALANGEVDAAVIMEPIVTLASGDGYTIIIEGREALPGHPGAVLAVSLELIEKRPDIVEKLVELHLRATALLLQDKDRAAELLSQALGPEILPVEVARRALDSPLSNFITDPRLIIEGTMKYVEFRRTYMGVDVELTVEDIFDASFYERLAGERR